MPHNHPAHRVGEPEPGALLVGAEEEFLLIDATTGRPAPRIAAVLPDALELAGSQAQEELHQAQIELATSPCADLADLRAELLGLRSKLVLAAAPHEAVVVASGTYPAEMGAAGRLITAEDRFQTMARENSGLAREQLICGCHIHVSVPDPESAIRAMNLLRRFLPVLCALAANSPYWEGRDTGFDSYRTEVWARWPSAGPPGAFESRAQYEGLVDRLVESGVILDRAMAYFDVRPSDRFPTLEIRIADVMPTVDDVVAVAGLARALVAWCLRQEPPAPPLRHEFLRAATWRAARSGLGGALVDPLDGTARPAGDVVEGLLERVGDDLERLGDHTVVAGGVRAIVEGGNGATRQRRSYAHHRDLGDVLGALILGPDGSPGGDEA